jgi:putative methionine-R-sulfoxide reductase with GAF domain
MVGLVARRHEGLSRSQSGGRAPEARLAHANNAFETTPTACCRGGTVNVFIQVIEVWKLSRRGAHLELEAGIYGGLDDFRWESERTKFEFGHGLPGQAWASRRPILLNTHEPEFHRALTARRADLRTAVAIPIFNGDFLGGVVVLICGGGFAGGALEVWSNSESGSIELEDGYYGTLSSLEESSRKLRLAPGEGLPGAALARREPVLVSPLSSAPEFKRAQALGEVEVTTGVALPVKGRDGVETAAVMLSARHTPIARSFELWRPDRENKTLHIANAYECTPNFQDSIRKLTVRPAEGVLGRAWVTGSPAICEDLGRENSRYAHWACAEGLRSACAIPFSADGRLQSILMLTM